MFKLVVLAVAVAVASASLDADWAIFKNKHGKQYSAEEEIVRRYVWQINMKKIEEHNELFAQGKSTYYLGENEYADRTAEEIVRQMNGFRPKGKLNPGNFTSGKLRATLPDTVDWRTKGYVTEVKNQGNCGSCWAFSTTGSMEGQHFKSTGTLVSLSESNLVDCSQRFGNHGCQGGLMDDAFRYIISNKGIDTEQSYPYLPENRPCKFQRNNVGSTENSYKDVESGSEDALQQAVATVGPISVAIDASKSSFHLYKGGVYNEPLCSSTRLDHGVLAVGYGTENGQDYWLVKNSWGPSWGQQGYIMMSRNKNNQCGIATIASYPIV